MKKNSFLLIILLIITLFVFSRDSTKISGLNDSISIQFQQLDKILQANKQEKNDYFELFKLFAPAFAGGITALIALIGISKQIRNSQNLHRIEFIEKKKDSLISTYSDLIFEIEKEGESGLINIMKQKPPSYYFAKKEVELKLQISTYIKDKNDYISFYNALNFYKENKINDKSGLLNWLNLVESEFKIIILKI